MPYSYGGSFVETVRKPHPLSPTNTTFLLFLSLDRQQADTMDNNKATAFDQVQEMFAAKSQLEAVNFANVQAVFANALAAFMPVLAGSVAFCVMKQMSHEDLQFRREDWRERREDWCERREDRRERRKDRLEDKLFQLQMATKLC